MRKVMVSERKVVDGRSELVEKGIAEFHQFSMESSAENTPETVAIIEWPDGQVDMVYPTHIRFIK
jgi:hypothetical protein